MNDFQIRCFFYGAQYLNFSKAADALFISKATFSRTISHFEEELNISLFVRDTKNVVLTTAGSYLYAEWSRLFPLMENAETRAYQISQGYSGSLMIGLHEEQPMEPVFQKGLKQFSEIYANVEIEMFRYDFYTLSNSLLSGDLDAIVTLDWEVMDFSDIEYMHVATRQTYLAVSNLDPILSKPDLKFEDFIDEKFVLPDVPYSNALPMALKPYFKKTGRTKNVNIEIVPTKENVLMWLEAGKGISLCNELSFFQINPALRCLTFPEIPPSVQVLAWNHDNPNPALENFKECLKMNLDS